MQTCSLPYKSAKDNTKFFLTSVGAIDDSLFILDKELLDESLEQLKKEIKEGYNLDGYPYLLDISNPDFITENQVLLDQIDTKRKQQGIYNDQQSSTKQYLSSTISESESEPESLVKSLTQYANKLGVKVEVVEDLLKLKGAKGIAQIKEFKILLQKGQESALTEEVAHFLVRLLDNESDLKKRLMDEAPRTRLYKKLRQDEGYKKAYGDNVQLFKEEVAAKLISLYLSDKEAFKHWSGSDQIVENIIRWIKDFFKWLKGNTKLNSFIQSADKILKLDTSGLVMSQAVQGGDMFALGDFLNKTQVLESLGDFPVRSFDKIYVNISNTILDYGNYPGTPADKRNFLFDERLSNKRDEFYSTSNLTTLGRELRDKAPFLNREIVLFTRMIVSPALRTRMEELFGKNIRIERTNVPTYIEDADGNMIKEGEETNSLQDLIDNELAENPNIKILTIDNTNNKVKNVQFRLFNERRARYERLEDRIDKQRKETELLEFNSKFLSELEKLERADLVKKVEQAFKIIRSEFNSIETTEAILSRLDAEEVSQIFRDEYGNLTLPMTSAEQAVKFLKELDNFEKGTLQFLSTIEGMISFFKERNESNYEVIKNQLAGDTDSVNKAIQELALITKIGNSWQNYIDEFREVIQGKNAFVVEQLFTDLSGQIDLTKRISRELSKEALSKRLSKEFMAYNLNIEGQIEGLQTKKEQSVDPKLIEILDKKIEKLKKDLKKPEDLIDIFNGTIPDMSAITVWVKQLHETGDPLLGSVNVLLQKAFAEVEIETIQRAQEMGSKVNEVQKTNNISQKDIEDNLVTTEFFYQKEFSPEENKSIWVKKSRLVLVNQWQNIHVKHEHKNPVDEAYTKWQEAKDNKLPETDSLHKDFVRKNKEYRKWETENWNRAYTKDYYNRYDSLLQTEEEEMLFEEVKSIQSQIYSEIEDLTIRLQMETNLSLVKGMNDRISDLRRDLKKLKRDTNDDGTLKSGKDLRIAKMLQAKSEIDRDIYEYFSDFKKFRNDFITLINTIPNLRDEVRNNLRLYAQEENFSKLYEYAKQSAPYQVLEWLDLYTVIRYSPEWYAARKIITDEISDISDQLSALYNQDSTSIKKVWEELFSLTSPIRDEDNILDGADATPLIQAKVLEFEKLIEQAKQLAKSERDGITSPEIKQLKLKLGELISQLHEIQLSTTTDYYNDEFIEQAQNSGFLEEFKTKYPQVEIDHNSNLINVINSSEFLSALANSKSDFVNWFNNNHLSKETYNEEGSTSSLVPTYIWYKKEPKNKSEILTVPSFKYSKRIIKDEFKNQKIDWTTWNPVTKEWLPLDRVEYKNPSYSKFRNPTNSKDRALFEILTLVTSFHISTQVNSIVREARIGFALPYMRKTDLDSGYFRNMLNNFTDKNNKFEQGEGNFDETVTSPTIKNRLISWFNGFIDETVEQESETTKFQRIAVPYTQFIEPENVSKDILLGITMFGASTNKANRMFKALPIFNLLEEVLENPPKLDSKGRMVGNNTNRLKALQFSKEYHLYGVNKKYELGSMPDKALMYIRKINTIGSLGLPFGFANTLKNNLQGRLQNLIGSRFADWSSPRSMRKAAANLNTNFISYVAQSELPSEKRSLDYQIITYFNPQLNTEIYSNLFGGAAKRIAKEKHIYLFNEAMEFSIAVNLLYGHLYHIKVKNGKGEVKELRDIFEFKEGKLTVQPGWVSVKSGREINEDYLLDTKLAYKTAAEYIQGKVTDKTALTQTTIGQALSYFKNWLLPMLRRRFDKKRENYMIGENLEGYWRAFLRMSLMMLRDLRNSKVYWNSFTEEEKRNYITVMQETAFMMTSLALLSLAFGFDADDPDKFKKLKDNSYVENLTLLTLLQAKNETESLSLMPFFNIEQQAVPPILTEGSKWVKNPTIGFSIIDNSWKTINYSYDLLLNSDNAYYQQNMPQYGIEKGDSKALHYLLKVAQIDDFLNIQNPERKIQSLISMMKM